MILNDKGEPFGAPFLVVASMAEVVAIGSMLEGMIEVIADDGRDTFDAQTALTWIWLQADSVKTFPAKLSLEQLSSEMVACVQATIDNVSDNGPEWNPDDEDNETPFTATITTR